ncbi:uncharacterized protein LOC127733656 [Mytilus californianus]|uniref:uncharacterized protein LOC127733656 n=1 Tax=Mytilus californianus TaxID=6549 RepID=UPI002246D3F3|nr:uncharacterized protein LOC127733656 [Mytilus californianus]
MKTRRSPYETQWDSNNPSNWTISKLKEELNKKGIRTPTGMSKQVLKQLYIENSIEGVTPIETQQTENVSDEINTDSSPENTVPINLAESVHQHRSSVSNGKNENGGTDRNKTAESQNIAQCFAGLQETFKQLIYRDNTHDTSRDREFNLQQWYNHAGIGNRSETYTSNRGNNNSLQGNTENASFISGTQIGNFSCGVRSDEYSNVDIISPSIQKQIIDDRQIPQTSSQCSTTSNEVPKQLRCNMVLNKAVNELWNSAIANTTRTVYDTGFRKFETFMLLNGFQFTSLPPISEDILIYFIAHCFKILSLQYSTIKLYLCGIRYKYVQGNHNDPLQSANNTPLIRLDYVLNSVKRLQKTKNHIRLPITFEILEKIVNCLRKGFCSKFTDLMLRTACIVAFYGFLRCGEFTVSKASQFDPDINLCIEDVVFHTDLVVLKLKQSKTDPFRKGINIQLHKLGQLICPYTILLEYIQIRKEFSPINQTDPLFITIDKKPLERQYFLTCIKKVLDICGFNSSHYNGHSFRIGAATSAGKAKIEDHLIKTLGRWSSDSYIRYIRVTPASIKTAQSRLGRI